MNSVSMDPLVLDDDQHHDNEEDHAALYKRTVASDEDGGASGVVKSVTTVLSVLGFVGLAVVICISIGVNIYLGVSLRQAQDKVNSAQPRKPKNVILMIADGFGPAS